MRKAAVLTLEGDKWRMYRIGSSYDSFLKPFEALPKWIKERLAVLMTCPVGYEDEINGWRFRASKYRIVKNETTRI